jgi:hypothetical protein
VLSDENLAVSEDLPHVVDPAYDSGDGVVPLFSAIPDDLKGRASPIHFADEFHASLPRSDKVILDIDGLIRLMQAPEFKPVRAALTEPGKEVRVTGLEDCYLEGAPITVKADVPGRPKWPTLIAEVWEDGATDPLVIKEFRRGGAQDEVVIEGIKQGCYRITISRADLADPYPQPSTDVFLVLPTDPDSGLS